MNHAQEALGALSKSRDWLEDEEFAHADLAVKRAQVHATLALAEQQRIANLIAAYDMGAADTPSGLASINYAKIRDQIMEALELGDPK